MSARRAAALLLLVAVAPLRAQEAGAVRPELRADLIAGRVPALELGLGVSRPVSTYARLVAVAGEGIAWHAGEVRDAGRVDLLGRFLLDPILGRSSTWYGAGGLSLLYDGFEKWRPLLTVGIGLEGAQRGPVSYAAELGLGGGARIGLVMRWKRSAVR